MFNPTENEKVIKQKEYFDKIDTFYNTMTKRDIYINSIKLSIYLCYYMRLSNKNIRKF